MDNNNNNKLSRPTLGALAENVAGRFLKKGGYGIIERNYRKPWGEIDIIAKMPPVTVFVEVKANLKRYAADFDPEYRVDRRKMSALIKTAMLYMEYEGDGMGSEWRIDIVSVIFDAERKTARIRHYKNVAEDFS